MVNLFFKIFFTVFIVVDPLGFVPLFISVSSHLSELQKRRTILKAVSVAFVIFLVFILGGRFILAFFGISPGSFFIAGGILCFLISMEMLFGHAKRIKTSGSEAPSPDEGDIAIFPLAIPMISGPGAITSVMLYSAGEYEFLPISIILLAVILITLASVYIAARASGLILKAIGPTGVSIIQRLMGMLLSGLAIQFIYDGLCRLGVIK